MPTPNNYQSILQMWGQERDPARKKQLRETLDCMEEAANNRGVKPAEWQKTPVTAQGRTAGVRV